MTLSLYNPETIGLEKTYLSSFQATSDTDIAVKNNDSFAVDDFILIGEMGGERSEIRQVTAVNVDGLELTCDALQFDHNSDTAVYKLEYNKVRIYRSTSENGTYTLQTTVDIDVDNEDEFTRWTDPTALTTHWYRHSWYNSETTTESEQSDPVQAGGPKRVQIGFVIGKAVSRVGDTAYNVLSFDDYLEVGNEVNDDLISQSQRPYNFLKETVLLDTIADQSYIDVFATVTNFWKFNYVEIDVNTTGSAHNYKQVRPLTTEQWDQKYNTGAVLTADSIMDIAFDEETGRLHIYPTPTNARTAKIKFRFYRKMTPFTSAGDVIETPTTLLYRYKFMAEYYSAKSEVDRQWIRLADKYEGKYGNEVVKMQRANRIDVGTPRSFRPERYRRVRRYHL